MKHTERLLKILNLLRNRRTVITAQDLAEKLGVSTRTIYRDVQKLEAAGVPVEGEAGVGYRILRRFELPPLMFDAEEVEALILGVKMVRAWSDQELAASANSALNKIVGILPQDLKDLEERLALEVPNFINPEYKSAYAKDIRDAIKTQHILKIQYESLKNERSEREIWPLGLFFWGYVWTLVSWCCLRQGYRVFRIDRIRALEQKPEQFITTESISLSKYLEGVKNREVCDWARESVSHGCHG